MKNQNNHRPTLNKRIVVDAELARKLLAFKNGCKSGEFDKKVEKKFGIKRRKARYVLQIADKLKKSELAWEKVQHLGWTKLKELALIITKENVDEILKKLANANIDTVKKFKRRYRRDGKLIVSPVKTMLLTLSPAQYEAIKKTLRRIKKGKKLKRNGDALAALCKSAKPTHKRANKTK